MKKETGDTNLRIEILKEGLSLYRFGGSMNMTHYLQPLPAQPWGSGDGV
jgi:hypothetical protein